VELDYKKMFEEMSRRIDALFKMDNEYFALMKLMNEQKSYTEKIAKVFLELKKSDQINVLKILTAHGSLCKNLCEKYSLFDDEEDVDNE